MTIPEWLIPWAPLNKEWLLALRLFGRLNGTEWECVMTVLHETWGNKPKPRRSAPLGKSDFQQNSFKSGVAIQKALVRLSRDFRVLQIEKEATPRSPRVWAPNPWREWAWGANKDQATRMIEARFPRRVPVEEPEFSEDAVAVARHLRGWCLDGNPHADVPPDVMNNRAWQRWCTAIQGVLDRSGGSASSPTHSPRAMMAVIDHAFADDFWQSRLRGPHAAARLVQHYDPLLAATQAAFQRRRT